MLVNCVEIRPLVLSKCPMAIPHLTSGFVFTASEKRGRPWYILLRVFVIFQRNNAMRVWNKVSAQLWTMDLKTKARSCFFVGSTACHVVACSFWDVCTRIHFRRVLMFYKTTEVSRDSAGNVVAGEELFGEVMSFLSEE